jgi:hypothetical protein
MELKMRTPSDISAKTTHDLWIDARQFSIDVSRPTPTSIVLTVSRPAGLTVTDGAVVLLSDKPITAQNYPQDGEAYSADTPADWLAPTQMIGNAQVVAAYHGALANPFPPTEVASIDATVTGFPTTIQSFTVTVNNTNPNTIYYASVHASSNVMQYYPIGVQSYPLMGELAERGNAAYTGNIPSYSSAPTAPTPGMVYHDQQLNIVQYYDGVSGSWIPTEASSILSGPYNPGILGQVYLMGGQLRIFNGVRWTELTPTNLKLRSVVGDPWVAMGRFSTEIQQPSSGVAGQMYYDFTTSRLFFYDGASWVYPNQTNTLFDQGTSLVPAFVTPITVETELLRNPYLGQLFYNTTTKDLNAWNGVSWNKVNDDQIGSPMTDKISIGNDGSYDARIQLIKVLNAQLGWPQMCVELQEEQFNIAIDNALQNYRQLSSGAYKRGFVLYKLIAGQQKYYLNSAIDKTDHIVDIHKIHRMGPMGVQGGGPNDVWAQAFAQQYYDLAAGGGDILSTHLVAAYGEELNRLFAGDLAYSWDEASHELVILRAIRSYETVVIEAMMERPEQELLNDRWCEQYIQNWALAELKMMLGLIRSKFASGTPGAAGTINLNGELLVSEARQDMAELTESLLNYEYGGQIGLGNVSFLMG